MCKITNNNSFITTGRFSNRNDKQKASYLALIVRLLLVYNLQDIMRLSSRHHSVFCRNCGLEITMTMNYGRSNISPSQKRTMCLSGRVSCSLGFRDSDWLTHHLKFKYPQFQFSWQIRWEDTSDTSGNSILKYFILKASRISPSFSKPFNAQKYL